MSAEAISYGGDSILLQEYEISGKYIPFGESSTLNVMRLGLNGLASELLCPSLTLVIVGLSTRYTF